MSEIGGCTHCRNAATVADVGHVHVSIVYGECQTGGTGDSAVDLRGVARRKRGGGQLEGSESENSFTPRAKSKVERTAERRSFTLSRRYARRSTRAMSTPLFISPHTAPHMCLASNLDTSLPYGPWPSATTKRPLAGLPASDAQPPNAS